MLTHQRKLAEPYLARFCNDIQRVYKEKAWDFRDAIYFTLSPTKFTSDSTLALLKATLVKIENDDQVSLK